MPLNLAHLLDPDPNRVPELPLPLSYNEGFKVEAGEGMAVSQIDDDVMVSQQEEPTPSQGAVFITPPDPLLYMSYRAILLNGGTDVFVQTSYMNNVYYSNAGGWTHESFQMASETLPITTFPKFLYCKFPVKFISASGLTIEGGFPVDAFTSEPQFVNSSFFTFETLQATGYVTRNRSVTPANYFILSDIAITDNTLADSGDGTGDRVGFWHFLIGEVTAAGVQQIHLGIRSLPQPMTFKLIDFSVS